MYKFNPKDSEEYLKSKEISEIKNTNRLDTIGTCCMLNCDMHPTLLNKSDQYQTLVPHLGGQYEKGQIALYLFDDEKKYIAKRLTKKYVLKKIRKVIVVGATRYFIDEKHLLNIQAQ